MNADRKQTVHYETVTSKMKRQHFDGFSDKNDIKIRQEWIESRVDYFVNHFQMCLEGLREITLFWETK